MAAGGPLTRPALRPCPLCGHGEVHVLHAMQFALAEESPLPRAYDVVSCAGCRFVYADTAGTPDDYARHYAEHSRYEDAGVATGGGDRAEDRARIEELAGWLAARVPARARVADIGCGNGGLLEALRRRGFSHLTGIDPAQACVARMRARSFDAWQGSLGQIPAAAGDFDLAILSHVLEHVLDPRGALRELRGRLARDGLLCVETPDASRYAGRPFVPFYFFDAEHINHFDTDSIADLGARTGYAATERLQGELTVEGGRRYPIARVLLALAPAAAGASHPALAAAAQLYIDESRRRGEDGALAQLVASGRRLALWGAGSQAQRLLSGPLAAARFAAVVDRDRKKQGLAFAGCRVAAPEDGLKELPRDTVVVVAAALAAASIVAECRSMGFQCHVPQAAEHAG